MAYSGFKGIGPNKLGCGDKGSPAKKYGAMKGDQSASRSDYKNYKGTDKGYHGKDGSSHGDQSASKADYNSPAKKYEESAAKKALKGNQNKLPDHLKAKIEAAPGKKDGAMKGDQSKTRKDYKNYKGTDKGYKGKDGSSHGDQSASKKDYGSPAKKVNKGMKYDIKEASNQNLSAKARKHYAENAQAASKSGYKG